MKHNIFFLIMAFLLSSTISAQEKSPLQNGDRFPDIKGQFLTRERAKIPQHFDGKVSLLIIAFKKGTQKEVDTWTKHLFPKAKQNANLRVIEVPMISGFYNWMSNWIDNGMRSGIPENLHNNVLTYYGALEDYYKEFDVKDKNKCYLFLLDSQGMIQYKTNGPATDEKLTLVNRKINVLLKELQ